MVLKRNWKRRGPGRSTGATAKDMKALVPARTKNRDTQVPVFIEKDEDGFYVVECPLFEGCYSQGKTVDEALRNIREVIDLIVDY